MLIKRMEYWPSAEREYSPALLCDYSMKLISSEVIRPNSLQDRVCPPHKPAKCRPFLGHQPVHPLWFNTLFQQAQPVMPMNLTPVRYSSFFFSGIVDTGTTLLYIGTKAFNAYVNYTGAKMDDATGQFSARYTFEFIDSFMVWQVCSRSLRLNTETSKPSSS